VPKQCEQTPLSKILDNVERYVPAQQTVTRHCLDVDLVEINQYRDIFWAQKVSENAKHTCPAGFGHMNEKILVHLRSNPA
jgi:hypothetical protein